MRAVRKPRRPPPPGIGGAGRRRARRRRGPDLCRARSRSGSPPTLALQTGRPRRARPGARALDRDRRAAPARHDPQGAGAADGKGHAEARRRRSNGRSSSPRRRSCFSTPPTMRRSTSRSRRRAPIRPARRSPRSPMRCCARSPAIATRFSRVPIRSTTIRPPGSPSAGARPMARARRAPSPRRTARSRRSTSASRATRPAGRSASAGSCCRPARCASTPMQPVARARRLYETANGGCRTPPRRCRRGFFGPGAGMRIADLCAAPGGKSRRARRGGRRS